MIQHASRSRDRPLFELENAGELALGEFSASRTGQSGAAGCLVLA